MKSNFYSALLIALNFIFMFISFALSDKTNNTILTFLGIGFMILATISVLLGEDL